MTLNENLTRRVRAALSGVPDVREKRMFGGIGFMVNGKFCVSVHGPRIMCRVDPSTVSDLIRREGCTIMEMNGRVYRGYVRVDEKVLGTRKALGYWIGRALEFNPKAKASRG